MTEIFQSLENITSCSRGASYSLTWQREMQHTRWCDRGRCAILADVTGGGTLYSLLWQREVRYTQRCDWGRCAILKGVTGGGSPYSIMSQGDVRSTLYCHRERCALLYVVYIEYIFLKSSIYFLQIFSKFASRYRRFMIYNIHVSEKFNIFSPNLLHVTINLWYIIYMFL